MLINSRRQHLNGYYLGALLFYAIIEIELYWGAVFFQDLFTHFHEF